MRVCVVSCFYGKDKKLRDRFISDYFRERGHEVTEIAGDFCHHSKTRITEFEEGTAVIPVSEYHKNISLSRIRSHLQYGRRLKAQLKRIQPDLVYCLVPVNNAALRTARWCKANGKPFIVDVVDLWPESLPIAPAKKRLLSPLLAFWRSMRTRALKRAAAIALECELYSQYLPQSLLAKKPHAVIYLGAAETKTADARLNDQIVELAYLGSINNIIDIDYIVELMTRISAIKPARLHIVGAGESKDKLLARLNDAGCQYVDHGAVYDCDAKREVFAVCRFGLNLYTNRAVIGLTYKSIDYFAAGLPLINSITGDTAAIITDNDCGINVAGLSIDGVARAVCDQTTAQNLEQRSNARQAFMKHFRAEAVHERLDAIITEATKTK